MERCVSDSFFTVRHLSSGTGQGLFGCMEKAAEYVGAPDWKTKLIGLSAEVERFEVPDRVCLFL